jgi:hypothetical protein
MPPLRPFSNVAGWLASELQLSRSSPLMRSPPSDAVTSVGGSADRTGSLDSGFDVCHVEPMPAHRGLSLRFIALRASALPLALGLIWSSLLSLLIGLACVCFDSWPCRCMARAACPPACPILTPVPRDLPSGKGARGAAAESG